MSGLGIVVALVLEALDITCLEAEHFSNRVVAVVDEALVDDPDDDPHAKVPVLSMLPSCKIRYLARVATRGLFEICPTVRTVHTMNVRAYGI